MDSWLQYSGRAPLNLFFELGLAYHHLKLFTELILLGHFSRCRHLSFHVDSGSAFALVHFATLPPGSLRSLESLVLENLDEADFEFQGDEEPAITVFQDSPHLKKVTTNILDFSFQNCAAGAIPKFDFRFLPWGRLTHLVITNYIRLEVFVVALSECTALQFLRASLDLHEDNEPWDMGDWYPQQRIALLTLAELYITLTGGHRFPPMMDAFTFPGLKHLHFRRSQAIDASSPSDYFSWGESQHFLSQLCSLQQLSLVGRVGSEQQVLILLRSASKATSLMLDIWTDYRAVIPELFPSPRDTEFIMPFLARIELHLESEDFPFPSDCIVVAAAHSVFLKSIAVYHLVGPGCRSELQEVCSSFESCRLDAWFGFLKNSARFRTDARLIDEEHAYDVLN